MYLSHRRWAVVSLGGVKLVTNIYVFPNKDADCFVKDFAVKWVSSVNYFTVQ